jgi:hypothetical protein
MAVITLGAIMRHILFPLVRLGLGTTFVNGAATPAFIIIDTVPLVRLRGWGPAEVPYHQLLIAGGPACLTESAATFKSQTP